MSSATQEMTRKVAIVLESEDLHTAYSAMKSLCIQHVPVVRDGKLVGILSDRDILLHSYKRRGKLVVPRRSVASVMSREVIVCRPDTSIARIAEQMCESNVHCVPVVDEEGLLVGIVTSTDLIRLLRDQSAGGDPLPRLWLERPRSLSALVN